MSANDQESLYAACLALIKQALYQHTPTADTAAFTTALLTAANVDPRVVTLLTQLLPPLCDTWRAASIGSAPSPPKLKSIDWQVSAGEGGGTVTMQLGVADAAVGEGEKIVFEMNCQGVDTFLDGLGKIKDQLKKVV